MNTNTDTPPTPDELAVAALFWVAGSFADHAAAWLAENRTEVRRILWGTEPHVRLGTNGASPETIRAKRRFVPQVLTREAVIAALPGAYEAPPWRGFAHTEEAFRDWHVTSHVVSDEALLDAVRTRRHDLDWVYAVRAQGQATHMHALLSFRFVHSAATVRAMLGLPAEAKLTPTHTDFGAAKAYLDNQATRTTEIGTRPRRRIYRDGNLATTTDVGLALEAIATGETTSFLAGDRAHRPHTRAAARALADWMRNAARTPHTSRVIHAAGTRQAREAADRHRRRYSGYVCELDFRQFLPRTWFQTPPDAWFGEEVVVLLHVPPDVLDAQLASAWLAAIPVVVYTDQRQHTAQAQAQVSPDRSDRSDRPDTQQGTPR